MTTTSGLFVGPVVEIAGTRGRRAQARSLAGGGLKRPTYGRHHAETALPITDTIAEYESPDRLLTRES
jgi:hypothetical protein